MANQNLTQEQLKELTGRVNELFKAADVSQVSADSVGFSTLADGYYLCELQAAELTLSKSSGNPMVSTQFKTVENGLAMKVNDDSTVEITEIKGTKNQSIFKHYVFKGEKDVKQFVSDTQKFESEPGKPILPKEAFTTAETIDDSLAVLAEMKVRIYVNVSSNVAEDGTKSTWYNLISWKRAAALGLKID